MSEDMDGLTVLSIDGASRHQSGVMPPLLILQEIASRYETDKGSLPGSFRTNKTFQMIGGVGDGGLLALMLGHFGISINDAIRDYRHILKAVHQHPDSAGWSKEERSQRLETVLKALVALKTSPSDENHPLTKPKEESPRCKVFVTAMHALNLQHPILLRNYRGRIDSDPPNCTLVEAIRATTAMPELFTPVTLGPPHRKIDYFSPACHGFNNPIDQVRQEAKAAFPSHSISCIISLGCGHPGPIQIKDTTEDAARAVVQLAMDSVRAAEQTYRRLVGIPNLYFRFDVPYGLERAVLRLNPTLSEIRAHITTYVGQDQTSDQINSAVKQLVERPASIKASELDGILPVETTATVWVKKCPLPSPNFTGRRDELDHMHAYFVSGVGSSSHIYVIYGLGGCGKTQLLLQFILECQTRSPRMFDDVYFADASLETTLEADLKAIAVNKNIGETAADTVEWLSYQTNRWMLVLDNADDKSFSMQKYIPKSVHGSVIITSRNPELAGLTAKDSGSRRIEDLEKWAAEELLKKLMGSKGSPSDGEDSLVTQVVDMLHCFPLAITQAGSYMSATGCGYQEYIELFQVERSRLLRERKGHIPDNYPWSVYTTWAISFEQLKTAPRHFMQICSHLHYTGIPKDLFKRAATSRPLTEVDERAQIWLSDFMNHTRNDEGQWNPVAFDEIIQNVMSFSLLDYDSETRLFSFHPLVHDWTREAIHFTHGQDFPDVQCALQLLALCVPQPDERSSTSFLLKRHLLPHLNSLVPAGADISSVPMALRISPVYEQAGRWNDLASIFERARESGGSRGGWDVETCTDNLASSYRHLGRHSEALNLQLSVVTSRKKTLGDEDPSTLRSMNNLAESYQALGRYGEALELHLSVLVNMKRTWGDEHPDTLNSMNNLAGTYLALGKHTEALDLQLLVLSNQKRALGDGHPQTLISTHNIASTYRQLGKHGEALDLKLSVLANMQETLGDEHPNTLLSLNNLAMSYTDLGMHAKALDLQVPVLENMTQAFGGEHPHTLAGKNNLSLTYCHLGRYAEALELQLSALPALKRTLGDEHPDTLTSMNNLASAYAHLGRHEEATDLWISAVNTATRVLGTEHPLTFNLQHRLEQCLGCDPGERDDDNSLVQELDSVMATLLQYEQEERWEDAIEQGEIAVEAFSGIMGEYNPNTVLLIFSLAMNNLKLGRTDDGRRHIERAYRLIQDDKFSSEGHFGLVLRIEAAHSRLCLATNPEEQASLAEHQANLVVTEAGRDVETLIPVAEDEPSPQVRAADAAETRRKALNAPLKDRREVKDDTATSGSTRAIETEDSRHMSTISPEIHSATTPKTSQAVTNALQRSGETSARKGNGEEHTSFPNNQNKQTSPAVINTPATSPSLNQTNVETISSILVSKIRLQELCDASRSIGG
ncbi:hypothetical protein DL96DRAFT_1211231 [Flagelloscypha sp. PMI_526]|nr:hypothetical protein DL96DRAFT_1211231 [Flagelloscypha sp. PMI_526]